MEGILEAPLNLAVTCDHRRDAPFVLGRAPVPATDLYSTCLAIENLWLAARAEGIGVGWVSLLDYAAVERLLGLPDGVQLVAYLCLGYPREFRATPMLEEVGWKARAPLADALFAERWGAPASLAPDAAAAGAGVPPALPSSPHEAARGVGSARAKKRADGTPAVPGTMGNRREQSAPSLRSHKLREGPPWQPGDKT